MWVLKIKSIKGGEKMRPNSFLCLFAAVAIASGMLTTSVGASYPCLLSASDMAIISGGSSATCYDVVTKNCTITVECAFAEDADCGDGGCYSACSKNKREDWKFENENGKEVTSDHIADGCGTFMENSSCTKVDGSCKCTGGTAGMRDCVQLSYIIGDSCD